MKTLTGSLDSVSGELAGGVRQTHLAVPGMHCGACMAAVERTLSALPGVLRARVNLSTKRVAVQWKDDAGRPPDLIGALKRSGFEANLFDEPEAPDIELNRLVKALAVAGFCSMNIMLLSVSVWAGAAGQDRTLFHLLSAVIAFPALAYSGRIFFVSAWQALRHGRMNMDVPISLGVLLTFAMSLYDTLHDGPRAYFDAAASLVFLLLIGRTLDCMMLGRARTAVRSLEALSPRGATVCDDSGVPGYLPLEDVRAGMTLMVAAGERIPVDGRVTAGRSDLDTALVTGESNPRHIAPGDEVQAGTLNLSGPLSMVATAPARESFLAEMVRMMEVAESGRTRYRRIADRASRIYAPAVHALAIAALAGWLVLTDDIHMSLTIAVAVLIITCPCALGLAVPMVQVMAARRLFEAGIMVRDGSALERLAVIDRVVFDKTGTLTSGELRLAARLDVPDEVMALAGSLAGHSTHPHARAIVLAAAGLPRERFESVREVPGYGLEGILRGNSYRLGRRSWSTGMGVEEDTVFARDGQELGCFRFTDTLHPDAPAALQAIADAGLAIEMISGDRRESVAAMAAAVGIDRFLAEASPAEKTQRLSEIAASGGRSLMVGDGLNDAPALAAAWVSMAPGSAADVGRNAADLVFLRNSPSAVPLAHRIAVEAHRLVRQNFVLAIGYNVIAVPVALMGYVTPLFAALAMSLSSITVVANALRLRGGHRHEPRQPAIARRPGYATAEAAP